MKTVTAIVVAFAVVSLCHAKSLLKYELDKGNVPVLNAVSDKNLYTHCGDVRDAGYKTNGTYRLKVQNRIVEAHCEFDKKNAFTLLMRREYPSISFEQQWHYYEFGFGSQSSNYWAGLANIYQWAIRGGQLQVSMQDWNGNNQNVIYRSFSLGPRDQRYRLFVSGFQGQVGDMLSYHNTMPFSTYDAPDPYQCAAGMRAGWWYNYCAYTLPTGIVYNGGRYTPRGDKYDGMFWQSWHGYDYALRFMQFMLIH